MLRDIEIAQQASLQPIANIAQQCGIGQEWLIPYGKYKAKVDYRFLQQQRDLKGQLILVTAINPTPAGEGKTTTSIGLADALSKLGKKTMLALREPSLGPVFGVKGGATGGGYAQVVPMEDINLHFTGDFHAISAANNLLAAMIDNHIYQGNELQIDPRQITWKRCVDMNDRQLRFLTDGLGGKTNGIPREDGFDITAASEVMAVFCLASSLEDLKERLGNMVVAYTYQNKPVTAKMLNAHGAMTALLKEAFSPNLVQTLEGTPALIHGGPFANIAHGCNSVTATKMALTLADYVITEAGFGADLGAEKFLHLKCRMHDLSPSACVIVATVRALKHHGGCPKEKLCEQNLMYLEKGAENLKRHIKNMKEQFGIPVCVALNVFPTDTQQEHDFLASICTKMGASFALSEVFAKGSEGGISLAENVLKALQPVSVQYVYKEEESIQQKIERLCKSVYKAQKIVFAPAAKEMMKRIEQQGLGHLPICVAKTQYSFSDDASLLAAPEHFTMHIENLRLCAGAGFVTVLMGSMMTMPGLPKNPAAQQIDVTKDGKITGLF